MNWITITLSKLGINLSSTQSKIAKNVSWSIIGKFVNVFSSVIIGILVARYLGPAQYGLMNYIVSYVSVFSILASFGLDNIEIRELSKTEQNNNELLGTAFNLRVFFSFFTVILIFATTFFFETDSITRKLIWIYSLSIILNSFNVIRNYFTSIVDNEYVVKAEISRSIIGSFFKVFLLLTNATLIWFIIALLFDFVLIASGYIYSYQKKVQGIINWYFNKKTALKYIKAAFPLMISGGAVILYQRIDQLMIKSMIDIESLGFYSVAVSVTSLIIFLPDVITNTVVPLLIKSKENDENAFNLNSQRFMDIIIWISIIMSIVVSISAYWLIKFTYGNEYLKAVPVLQIMSFKSVGQALSSTSGQLIIINNIQKWSVIRNIVGIVVCIIMNFWLIPLYGIVGSAIASVITVFFTGFISNAFIPQYSYLAKMQGNSLILGWKELLKLTISLRKNISKNKR
jgi:O-antigen/teichoic acid export membrane protein